MNQNHGSRLTQRKFLQNWNFERSLFSSILVDAAKKFPEKIAIHFMGKEMTYKELYDESLSFASYLQQIWDFKR